jgi:aminopeptidase N
MRLHFLLAFLTFTISVTAQNSYRSYLKDATAYREHSLDITKMRVEVSFVPEKGLVKGKVTHSFTVLQKQVDSVFFDGPEINIKTATLNNQSLPFTIVKTGDLGKTCHSFKMG